VVKELSLRLHGQKVEVQVIRNDFFGEHISVAGLITWADISSQIKLNKPCTVILPAAIFNQDKVTLDGINVAGIRRLLGVSLLVIDQFWEDWQRWD
jgi:NifB/MoaA-like Fe-S oxidoreductase